MDTKFYGFAIVTVLSLSACNTILNKDKAISSSDTTLASTKIAGTTDSVKVVDKPAEKDSNLKYVYLTFDDGPDRGTLNCYETCKQKGVKATFFLIGEHSYYPHGMAILDTMRKDMRHFIFANHSYTHAGHNRYVPFYKSPETALQDFLRVHDSLHFQYPIARFPGNNAWVMDGLVRSSKLVKPLSKLMDSVGYNVMGWDVEWHFDHQSRPVQSAELMAKQVINALERKESATKNHVVLLAHDRMFREQNYRDSLFKMISILQTKKGYVFETADQYPKLKHNANSLIAARK